MVGTYCTIFIWKRSKRLFHLFCRMMLHAWSLKFFESKPTTDSSLHFHLPVPTAPQSLQTQTQKQRGGGVSSLVGFAGDAVFVAPDPLSALLELH